MSDKAEFEAALKVHSAIFQVDWEDLLKSAPVSINALGSALVASSSDVATSITFTPVKKRVLIFEVSSLRAKLVECGNIDRFAFVEAETSVFSINDISQKIYDKKFDSQKGTVEEAKKITDKLGKQLDVASEDYNKHLLFFPMGQQIVGELADTLITTMGQAINAYTSNLNHVARVEKGGGNPKPKSLLPQYSYDPASWGWCQMGDAVESADNPDKTASFVYKMPQSSQEQVEQSATGNPPSKRFQVVLDTAVDVTNAIREEASKAKDIAKDLPGEGSELVKGWQRSSIRSIWTDFV
ncbi:hypothetical protein BBP40_007781 [Aspergillus hancockii]|nr:hypothetical protein BBP40_007781 [Aspergillus hancockii]